MEDIVIYNKFYIYGLYKPDKKEQLFYIGKGQNGRMYDHRKEAKLLINTTKKRSLKIKVIHCLWRLGLDFNEQIIYDKLTEQKAFVFEKELIKKHGRIDLKTGCLSNLTDGGEGPAGQIAWNKDIPRTDIVKDKLRNANLGKTYSEEVNKSKGRKGRISNNKGVKQTEESNIKRRVALLGKLCPSRGRVYTKEERIKMSIASKGRKLNLSEEQLEKRRLKMIGNTICCGRKHSEETKEKIKIGNIGKTMSIESRLKMSEAKRNYIPWNKKIA